MNAISRRLFLHNASAAGAAALVAAPAAAEPNPHQLALWHMYELERLAKEDGAGLVAVMLIGHARADGYEHTKMLLLKPSGGMDDQDGMFSGGRQ